MTLDLIVDGGLVYDGLGRPAVEADLGIKNGRVTEVGRLKGRTAARRLDASGLATAPGFIDTHAHSDLSVIVNPVAESQVAQGVTTEVFGHCGMSPYPLSDRSAKHIFHWIREGTPGRPPFDWSSAAEYFAKVRRQGLGLNLVPLAGHVTARADVVGDEDRPLTAEETAQLLARMEEGFAAGCRGMTSGLFYPPTTSADAAELTACAKLMRRFPGAVVYTAHVRDQDEGIEASVNELLTVGRAAGVAVHVSHLGVGWRANHGKGARVVEQLTRLRGEGLPVTADTLPYPNKGPFWAPRVVLPESLYDFRRPWRQQAIALQLRLADPLWAEELTARLEREPVTETARQWGARPEEIWEAIVIDGAATEWGRGLVGLTMAAAASRLRGRIGADGAGRPPTPARLFVELLRREGPDLSAVIISTSPEDERAILTCPFISFGTDSTATRVEDVGSPLELMQAHPRMFGTFPRVLGFYAREQGLLSLPEAVRRMTSLPASIFGLENRGVIRPGAWADLVVFNPDTICEVGTFLQPRAYPKGLRAVVVNGIPVFEDGRFSGELPGRLLTSDVE